MEKEADIGALWIKDGKNGKFMSGKIKVGDQEVPVVVFRNTYKEEGSNKPDYKVYRQQPRDGEPKRALDKDDIPF
jgi:hypothetical protein